jgi:hypothetical protein
MLLHLCLIKSTKSDSNRKREKRALIFERTLYPMFRTQGVKSNDSNWLPILKCVNISVHAVFLIRLKGALFLFQNLYKFK